jgi:hypothetical protein
VLNFELNSNHHELPWPHCVQVRGFAGRQELRDGAEETGRDEEGTLCGCEGDQE